MGDSVFVNFDDLVRIGSQINSSVAPFSLQCGSVLSIARGIQTGVPGLGDAMLRYVGAWEHDTELLSQEVQLFGTAVSAVGAYYAAQEAALMQGIGGSQ